jgi:hypothetical protein
MSFGFWFNTGNLGTTANATSDYIRLFYIMKGTGAATIKSIVSLESLSTTNNTSSIDLLAGGTGLLGGAVALADSTWYYLTCYQTGDGTGLASLYCSLYGDGTWGQTMTLKESFALDGSGDNLADTNAPITGIMIYGGSSGDAATVYMDDIQIDAVDGTYPLPPIQIEESGCTSDGQCSGGLFCDIGKRECVQCTSTSGCADDEEFCNGVEVCINNVCVSSGNPCFDIVNEFSPSIECIENGDYCYQCRHDDECDDGLYCNGAESCPITSDWLCHKGTPPCPGRSCSEETGCKPSSNTTTVPNTQYYPPTYFFIDPDSGDDASLGRTTQDAWKTLGAVND